ncbi:MAG: thiamine pyrophosphate-dependent enzyme [Thermoplasmata archaeon]|nr:thiamine pyrophosphate-dependent enzyme [Thermoplasmata archaeon]
MNPTVVPLPYDDTAAVTARLGSEGPALLKRAYRWMLVGRTLDQRMLALQRQGRIGFYGPATGQEGVNVAAGLAAGPTDWIFPGLREQLVALVRGHGLTEYLHHLFANGLDPALGRQMPCHPTAREVNYVSMSSVVGTQITQAVGAAYAMRHRKDNAVTLGFFGDGATSANDFHAGLNFAAVFGLPIVFGLANNQWAISQPVERQSGSPELVAKAAAYGLPGVRVDGTDLLASYAALREALATARSGGGPTLVEFVTYRMTPHSSSDDPARYQRGDWADRALAHDPLLRVEELLHRLGLIEAGWTERAREEIDVEIRAAVVEAEKVGPPLPETMTNGVFANASPSSSPPERT